MHVNVIVFWNHWSKGLPPSVKWWLFYLIMSRCGVCRRQAAGQSRCDDHINHPPSTFWLGRSKPWWKTLLRRRPQLQKVPDTYGQNETSQQTRDQLFCSWPSTLPLINKLKLPYCKVKISIAIFEVLSAALQWWQEWDRKRAVNWITLCKISPV